MTALSAKVLVTRPWPAPVEARLKSLGATLRAIDDPLSEGELAAAMMDFDALCTTITDRVTPTMIRQSGRRVRLLCNYGAGLEHIPIDVCRQAGVVVTSTPDVLSEATAELAITLMLMVARRAGEGERQLRAGEWTGWRPTHMIGAGVAGKTLGLVGYGRIGRVMARMVRGLDMRVCAYVRSSATSAGLPNADGVEFIPDLETLLKRSDFVSLHVPGGPETHHLIGRKELAAIGPTGFLINTARGSVVDEDALVAALAEGTLGGAGLDVYAGEPQLKSELLTTPNVVLLPHLGSATAEARDAMGFCALANLEAWLAGKALPNAV